MIKQFFILKAAALMCARKHPVDTEKVEANSVAFCWWEICLSVMVLNLWHFKSHCDYGSLNDTIKNK